MKRFFTPGRQRIRTLPRCDGALASPPTHRKTSTMNRLLIAALCLTAASAFAQTNTPRVDQREANQQARIAQGAPPVAP